MLSETNALAGINIAALLPWSRSTHVRAKTGEFLVRSALANDDFWRVWQEHKEILKRAGVSVKKTERSWEAQWWEPIPQAHGKKPDNDRAHTHPQPALVAVRTNGSLPCPKGLRYLDYQIEAVRFGLQCWAKGTGVLIADEMGLGKTIEAIALVNADADIRRVLVVCPNTLKLTWHRELTKWLVRPLRVAVQHAAEPWVGSAADVVVINYDIVHRFEKDLNETAWCMRVLDEAHYVKNHRTRRTKFTLSIPAKRKVALTGTPIENRPVELFPVLNDLDPRGWPNFHRFAHRYCDAKHDGYGWDYSGASHEAELNKILRSTVLVRRFKQEVLAELPPKRHRIIELDSTGLEGLLREDRQQYEACNAQLDDLRLRVSNAKISNNPNEHKAAIKALRQCQGGYLESFARVRHKTALAKLPQVIAFTQDALEDGKVIVFAHHLDVIDRLKKAFPQAAVVTGKTRSQLRQHEADRFQIEPACNVFLGNAAAAEGLTLTASSHVIFAEADWVPGKLAQKEDRAHRIGQTRSLLCSYLVIEGSVEAHMLRRIIEKQEVISAVLNPEMGFLGEVFRTSAEAAAS